MNSNPVWGRFELWNLKGTAALDAVWEQWRSAEGVSSRGMLEGGRRKAGEALVGSFVLGIPPAGVMAGPGTRLEGYRTKGTSTVKARQEGGTSESCDVRGGF